MLYVGLTEKHKDSAKLFATIIHRPLSGAAHVLQGMHTRNPTTALLLTRKVHWFVGFVVFWFFGWAGNPTQKGVGRTHLQQKKNGGGAGGSRRLQAIPTLSEKVGWERDGRGGAGWGRQPWLRRDGAIERRRKLIGVGRMNPRKRRAALEQGSNNTQAEEVAQVGEGKGGCLQGDGGGKEVLAEEG